ncbi:hypothetical protein AB6A40_005631 [Gnathostoma spinigerum]|uniref:Gamma-glutamylcyclotransferase family protein n=1 Tax=Gnathostoma spinigerum TaxID=75299 RepID=A0ABD6EQT9_9BILA
MQSLRFASVTDLLHSFFKSSQCSRQFATDGAVERLDNLVFVYGTLKNGEPNHRVMTDPTTGNHHFIGRGRTESKFPLVVASKFNIPFCLYSPGQGMKICGEVYAVDDDKMRALDELENHPVFYQRKRERVLIDNGAVIEPWLYFLMKWEPSFLNESSECIEDYSSSGTHGRPYNAREQCQSEKDL